VTTNQLLIGLGLIVVLAVGSQVLASRLRIPALIVLLPAASDVLFVIRADGRLVPVTEHATPAPQDGDTTVFLDPRPQPTAAGAAHIPPHSASTAAVPPQAPAAEPATPRVPLASSPDTGTEQAGTRS
jgi:hypothetical protein